MMMMMNGYILLISMQTEASTMFKLLFQYARFVLLNIRFNVRVYWKLFCTGQTIPDLHLIHNELQHFPIAGPIPFLFSTRGRTYFLHDGRLLPQITAPNSYSNFRKLPANRHWPIGKAIGKAATAAGDHPLMALKGRGKVRGLACHGEILGQLGTITEALKAKLHHIANKSDNKFHLYREMVRCSMAANFEALYKANFQDVWKRQEKPKITNSPGSGKGVSAVECLDRVEGIVNSTSSESLGKEALEVVKFFKKVMADVVRDSPEGTFGGGLMELYEDGEFTLEMLHDIALFYAMAMGIMPAIHLHWFVMTLIRNPGHLDKIREGLARDDRTYLRMCQKEVLRMFPPVSAYAPRKTKKQILLGKHTSIPAGSLVVAFPSLMVDDHNFNPEQWRNDHDLIDAICEEGKPFYAPFSCGVRVCVARHLVSSFFEEMMASILQDFDFQLTDQDPWARLPSVLSHYPRSQIGFRPAKDLNFTVSRRHSRQSR